MPTTKVHAVTVVTALVGLVVSVAAVWPRPGPEVPPARDIGSGPPVVAEATRPSPSPTPSPSPSPRGRPGPAEATAAAPEKAAPAPPTRVSIGSIDLAARVRPVGVASSGQMQLPPDPRVLGWYRFGPTPGQPGSTVLAGHLDSFEHGLGPLVRLRDVAVGDRVRVRARGGGVSTYSVVSVERFPRESLPPRLFARSGAERLRIITCGGEYDAGAGGYQQNLVVTARPT